MSCPKARVKFLLRRRTQRAHSSGPDACCYCWVLHLSHLAEDFSLRWHLVDEWTTSAVPSRWLSSHLYQCGSTVQKWLHGEMSPCYVNRCAFPATLFFVDVPWTGKNGVFSSFPQGKYKLPDAIFTRISLLKLQGREDEAQSLLVLLEKYTQFQTFSNAATIVLPRWTFCLFQRLKCFVLRAKGDPGMERLIQTPLTLNKMVTRQDFSVTL